MTLYIFLLKDYLRPLFKKIIFNLILINEIEFIFKNIKKWPNLLKINFMDNFIYKTIF